jgi:hypothetical protein
LQHKTADDEKLKQQMQGIWRKDMTLPYHHQLKMSVLMAPKFLQMYLLIILRVIRYAESNTLKMPLYALTPNDSIAKPLQTPLKDSSMHGIIGFASAINAKAMFGPQALAGSSPRGGRASGPNDNGSNLNDKVSIVVTTSWL